MEGAGISHDDVPLPDAKVPLRAIALTRRICEANAEGNVALLPVLRRIQAKMRQQVSEGQAQTKVHSFK